MADFAFHDRHLPPQPRPEPGVIEGTLNPLLDGPGDYRIQILEHPSGRRIAEDAVNSPAGSAVPVRMPHEERPRPGQTEPFQRNVRVQIDDEPPRPNVAIWLRQPEQ